MALILRKYLVLMATGGLLYVALELVWRGRSHWTMFLLGGTCFICLGLINEILPGSMALWTQILSGMATRIVLDDWLRYGWWGEERPRYKLF